MFGLRQRDTGITKYPVRNRQRVISYAVTIAFSKYNPSFVAALRTHLFKLYPLVHNNKTVVDHDVVHVYYTSQHTHAEWVPFVITILMVFLYVYFSCKRIE